MGTQYSKSAAQPNIKLNETFLKIETVA